MQTKVVKLEGSINTDFSGIKQLHKLYHECNEYSNTDVSVDFYGLSWIDANLCSLFASILYKLQMENKLRFTTDISFLEKNFDVLFRNGFIQGTQEIVDHKKSCVTSRWFEREDKQGFTKYISDNLMSHDSMSLAEGLQERITDDLIEIFANYNFHSNTTLPFFAAGQFYPKQAKLKFTMVDLGVGFLHRIREADAQINTHSDAIQWALTKGNSTKWNDGVSGGLGISSIFDYCKKNKGELDIVTGSHYWSSTYEHTYFPLGRRISDKIFAGSLINLTFSTS